MRHQSARTTRRSGIQGGLRFAFELGRPGSPYAQFDPDINRVVGGIAQIFHAVLEGWEPAGSPALERVSRTLPCSSVNLRWLGVSVTTSPRDGSAGSISRVARNEVYH